MKNSDKNHIALFLPTLVSGGVQLAFVELAQDFLELGYRVDMVVKEKVGDLVPQFPQEARIIDLGKTRMAATAIPLARYLKKERPDLLISGMELPNVMAVIAIWISRVQTVLVISFHGMFKDFDKRTLKRSIEITIARLLFPYADHIVVVTPEVALDTANIYGLPLEKCKVITSPIPLQKIRVLAKEPVNHPFFEEEIPVILGIGRLHRIKDFRTLINGFAKLYKKHEARLIILGEGEMRKNLEVQIKRLNLTNVIDLPGFVENPYKYLKRADVFVLSSLSEGVGRVLVEAVVLGCPIVATDCAEGISEFVDRERYGKIVPVGDANQMAEAIQIAIKNGKSTVPEQWLPQFNLRTVTLQFLELMDN